MTRRLVSRLVIVLLLTFAGPAFADENWVGIAAETINVGMDGAISIDVSKAPGAFRGIRVFNKGGGLIDLSRVQIVYSDGSVHNEDRQIDLKAGERSREIAAGTDEKFVDKVNLTWRASKGQGSVQIFGLQSHGGRKMERPKGPASGDLSTMPAAPQPSTFPPDAPGVDEGIPGGVENRPSVDR